MALSEYELRILREIETDLQQPAHPHWARVCLLLRACWPALVVGAMVVALVAVLAVFATSSIVAVPAAVLGAVAGFAGAATWQQRARENH